jgi:hypothetical protein
LTAQGFAYTFEGMRRSLVNLPKAITLAFVFATLAGVAHALDTSVEEFTCKEIGFKPKTEKFANCVLELYERKSKGSTNNPVGSRQAAPAAQAQRGDGSQDDQTCQRYGLKPGQPEYGNCRMQINLAKQQAAREQARYEAEMAAYEKQKQELEAERKRQLAMRQLQMGLGLMSGPGYP